MGLINVYHILKYKGAFKGSLGSQVKLVIWILNFTWLAMLELVCMVLLSLMTEKKSFSKSFMLQGSNMKLYKDARDISRED